MNRIRWELRRLGVWLIRRCLVPLFRPIVWYIVFHDLLRRPDHLYYIRERTKLLDRFQDLFGSAAECTSRQQVYDLAIRRMAEAHLNGLLLSWCDQTFPLGDEISSVGVEISLLVGNEQRVAELSIDAPEGSTGPQARLWRTP